MGKRLPNLATKEGGEVVPLHASTFRSLFERDPCGKASLDQRLHALQSVIRLERVFVGRDFFLCFRRSSRKLSSLMSNSLK